MPQDNDLQNQSSLALHATKCLAKLRVFLPIVETAAWFIWERKYVDQLHRYGQKLQKSFHNYLQSMDSSSGNKLTFSNSKIKVLSTEFDIYDDVVTH